MSARDDYPNYAGTFSTAKIRDHIEPAIYDAAMDEIDRLRAECLELRALDTAHLEIVRERDALQADLLVLRTALVKWKHVVHDKQIADAAYKASWSLLDFIPDDDWGHWSVSSRNRDMTAPTVQHCMMLVQRTACGAPTTLGCRCCEVAMAALETRDAAIAASPVSKTPL